MEQSLSQVKFDRNPFQKIVSSGLLTYLFTYLNIANANALLYVCKRFRNHLLQNDKKCLRLIGSYTYGLDKMISFSMKFPLSIVKTSFKSNIYPIIHMAIMENLNFAAISPGSFENGLFIWDISSGIFQFDIKYNDEKGESAFVYSINYIEDLRCLLVSYSDGFVLRYNIFNYSNSNCFERYEIKWKVRIGVTKPIKALTSIIEKETFITLETNEDIGLNFIKQYSLKTGGHIKSSIISNCIIINMKAISMLHISTNPDQESSNHHTYDEHYLVMSIYEMNFTDKQEAFKYNIKDTKISIAPLAQIKGNLTEISLDTNLYGHTSEIKDFIYIKSQNVLLSVGIDLFIIIWDLSMKNIKKIFDSAHEDIIYSIANINDDFFATCGKDRNIFVWSITNILNGIKEPVSSIAKHVSDIYQIGYYHSGNTLISGSFDKTMRSFKLSDDYLNVTSQRKLTGHTATITCAKFDYLKMEVITAGLDQCINYWDLKSMSIVRSIDIKQKEFFDDFIILFDDIGTIIKIDSSKKVKCFNAIKEEFYHTIEETSIVRSILSLYDGVSFILGLSNSEISFYNYTSETDKKTFKRIKTLFHGDENDPKASKTLRLKKIAYLHYEEKYIASGANDGSVCVFGIDYDANYKLFISSPSKGDISDIVGLNFTKDEKRFCFVIEDTLYLYDIVSNSYKSKLTIGKMLSIDKLNNDFFITSLVEANKANPNEKPTNAIHIININTGQSETRIEATFGNIKPLYYMQNGTTILAISGSPITGFSIDIINLNQQ